MGLVDPSQAVLAGSPAFLSSLLPHLAGALGVRPRVADAPHQAFALCQDGARLLVFEYRGQEWLPLAEDLKTAFGDELLVLVAVPREHATASGPLLGTGADEVLPWEGKPDPIVAAARRLAGLLPAAPSAAARPEPAATPAYPMAPLAPAVPLAPARLVPPPLPPSARQAATPPAPAEGPEVDEPCFSVIEAPPDAEARWGDAELIAFERSGTWPGTVLASRDAEGLLAGALAGFWPEVPDLKSHTERVVGNLSPLERDAIAGRPVPADPAPICRAAALRWQVSAALATAPASSTAVDSAAVRAILAEIDAVLAELKRASQGAPPEGLPGLDQLRRDLVSEAVDLTEAVHRIAPQEAPLPEGRGAPAAVGRTRLVSMGPSDLPADRAERRRQARTWAALGLAAVAGATYHGWQHFLRPEPPAMPRPSGAPAGFMAPPTVAGGVTLFAPEKPGKEADRAEVDRFRANEALKGNTVQEIEGLLLVVPEGGAAAPGDRRPPGQVRR